MKFFLLKDTNNNLSVVSSGHLMPETPEVGMVLWCGNISSSVGWATTEVQSVIPLSKEGYIVKTINSTYIAVPADLLEIYKDLYIKRKEMI
jgi:hypothetical protein